MSTIDDQFGNFANAFLSSSLNVICLFFSSVVMAGWYALISGTLITFMGVSVGRVYLKSQLGIIREMRYKPFSCFLMLSQTHLYLFVATLRPQSCHKSEQL